MYFCVQQQHLAALFQMDFNNRSLTTNGASRKRNLAGWEAGHPGMPGVQDAFQVSPFTKEGYAVDRPGQNVPRGTFSSKRPERKNRAARSMGNVGRQSECSTWNIGKVGGGFSQPRRAPNGQLPRKSLLAGWSLRSSMMPRFSNGRGGLSGLAASRKITVLTRI